MACPPDRLQSTPSLPDMHRLGFPPTMRVQGPPRSALLSAASLATLPQSAGWFPQAIPYVPPPIRHPHPAQIRDLADVVSFAVLIHTLIHLLPARELDHGISNKLPSVADSTIGKPSETLGWRTQKQRLTSRERCPPDTNANNSGPTQLRSQCGNHLNLSVHT
jgi:hypothetical protein